MPYPLPTKSGEAPTYREGKPLYQYSSPFVRHAGRFLDSVDTQDYQNEPRTLRANGADIHDRKVYLRIGSHFVRYENFFGKLGTNLSSSIIRPGTRPGPLELYLPWDRDVYPERDRGWHTYVWDGQDRLFDHSFDGRGRVALAYNPWGFGIVDDVNLSLIHQVRQSTEHGIHCFYQNGRHLAFNFGRFNSQMWDVTDEPIKVFDSGGAFGAASAGEYLAIATSRNVVIYPDLNKEAATIPIIARDIATDGAHFFVLSSQPGSSTITVLSAVGEILNSRTYPGVNWRKLRYNDGHLTVTGFNSVGIRGDNVWLLKGLDIVPLGDFIQRHYFAQSPDYYVPVGVASGSAQANDALYVQRDGKEYLILSFRGLGDVYEIDTGAEVVEPPPPPDPTPPDPKPEPEPEPEHDCTALEEKLKAQQHWILQREKEHASEIEQLKSQHAEALAEIQAEVDRLTDVLSKLRRRPTRR